jgi:hypothetical protein
MNRRKLFGLLVALPVAGAVFARTLTAVPAPELYEVYQPRMREIGQWQLASGVEDEIGQWHYVPERYMVRHDIAFMDQHGENNQWGVDSQFDHEPTEEELKDARATARRLFKRMERPSPGYVCKDGAVTPAKRATWPVGPSATFKLEIPPHMQYCARYV